MSAFDAVAYVVGEGAAYVTGRILGRVFKIERERALRIGQYAVIGVVAAGGIALCLIYT
jgi:hypothetical protein